jgi:predicted MFS family arabinose efflux permease
MAKLDRQRTLVLAALFVALFFIVAGAHNTVPIFLTPFMRKYGWSHSRVAVIPTVFALVFGLSSPVIGWLVDRFEVHRVMVVGVVITVAGMLLAASANAFGPMVFAYVVIGAGSAMASTVPLTVIAARWFADRRGFAMGVAVAGMSSGGVILPPVTDYIIRTMSIGAAYVALAAPVALIALPLVAFVIRYTPPAPQSQHADAPATELPGLDFAEAMRSVPFWTLIGALFLGSISLISLFFFITPSLIHAGFSSRNAALVQSAQNLVAVPGLIIAGTLADRFSGRKVAAALLAGLGVSSLLLMEAGSRSPAWPLYVILFIVLFGSTAGVTTAVFPIALAELVGLKRFGTLSGFTMLAGTFGAATGPLLVGRLFDLSGSYALGFKVAAGICFVSAAMTLTLVMAGALEQLSPAQIRAAAARH